MLRRQFLKTGTTGLIGASLLPLSMNATDFPDAVWIENGEPETLLKTALNELGGLNRFISPDDVVVIKPNIGWDRAPEYAANTNPDLISELVKECFNAGAKKVKIFDRTCNNQRRCYNNSQIQEKAEAVGANVYHIRKNRFTDLTLKKGQIIKKWPIYRDYLEADKVINVPVAKHHSLSSVTLGLKNLMGVMGGNRGSIHTGFDQKLIDICSEILPNLTIIDAYRILTSSGPQGGNLAHVKLVKTVIASSCVVTADCLALDLFGHSLNKVGHIKEAVNRGLNKFNFDKLNVKKVTLS